MMQNKAMKRSMVLSAIGITIQTIGGIFLIAGTVCTVKEVSNQLKLAAFRKLEKEFRD